MIPITGYMPVEGEQEARPKEYNVENDFSTGEPDASDWQSEWSPDRDDPS